MSVKFAIQVENQFGYTWDQLKEIIQLTEKHGYHSFYICDHFFLDKDSETRNALESWSVLTAAAMITERIKLGTLVTGNNYRNPALLAKIAATLDNISNGRMEFGIGAGWKEIEYEAYGYPFPSVKDRMDMLEESIQIVKALWTQARTNFAGKHYQIRDAVFAPKPVQKHPLFLIGGNGEKRTLKLVAKYADYTNLLFMPTNQIQQKLDALKGHCKKFGRDYEDVGKSVFRAIHVEEETEQLEAFFKQRASHYNIGLEEYKKRVLEPDSPGEWVGTPEQVRDRIEYLQGMGFDYFFTQMPIDLGNEQIEKLASLVFNKYFK